MLEQVRNCRQFITSCSEAVVVKTTHEGVQMKTKTLSREKLHERREEDWNNT